MQESAYSQLNMQRKFPCNMTEVYLPPSEVTLHPCAIFQLVLPPTPCRLGPLDLGL